MSSPAAILQRAQDSLSKDASVVNVYNTLAALKQEIDTCLAGIKDELLMQKIRLAQFRREEKYKADVETVAMLTGMAQRLADNAGYTLIDLRKQCRARDLSTVRHLVMYGLILQGASLVLVGRIMHRDHTTVIAARQRINDLVDTQDPYLATIWRKVFRTDLPRPTNSALPPVGGVGGGPLNLITHHSSLI